ncbi:MAG TPA: hypothetical protein DDZ53_13190 [Firmicutes bacterium]|jgi:hypothetical protein|nr:hypothetical protein [Bacillota bacterium]
MIDKQGRLFGKINIFDLIVILILVVIAGRVVYVKLNVPQVVAPPQDKVTIELRAEVLNPVAEFVKVGQRVTDKRTGVYLGEIKEIEVTPLPVAVAGANGEVIWADSLRHVEVRMVLSNQGTVTENVYQLGALGVRVGERITLVGPQFSFDAYLTALSKEK